MLFFLDSLDAGLCGAARRASVGARRAARRRSVVQCSCVCPIDGRACHDGYTPCFVSCSTLPVRAFRWRLWALTLLCCLFFFALFPSVAHAQPSLEISGNPTGLTGNDKGYVVVNTNNEYDAALEVLGLWGTKIQLDQYEFAKLSNPETGGAFYTFASSFFRLGSDGVDYHMYPGWAGDTYYQTLLVDVYGFGNVWGVETNAEDMEAAKRDYNIIRNGGSLGGGGSTSDVYTFSGGTYFRAGSPKHAFSSGGLLRYYVASKTEIQNGTVAMASTDLVVNVPVSCAPNFFAEYGTGAYDLILNISCSASGVFQTFSIRAFPMGHLVWETEANTVYTTSSYYSGFDLGEVVSGRSLSLNVGSSYDYSGNTINVRPSVVDNGIGSGYGVSGGGVSSGAILLSGGVHAGPTLPPNNWPDDDPVKPTPDPPEVPEPPTDEPVIGEAPDLPEPVSYPVDTPYTPDPDPPTNPIITYDPDPTGDPIDYRPWLNAILDLLRTINTTLDDGFYELDIWLTEHCDHIRKQIHDEALSLGLKLQAAITNGFVSFERWLQTTFTPWFLDSLDVRLNSHLRELEGYLNDLFVWLANELDFTVSGGDFDDSTVVSWLKKIYLQLYQLGNREASDTEQKLGTIDYDSTYGRVSAAYGELGDNLPFCVPDDMSTVLGWFVTLPVTPVFDVPWGFAGGSSSCHVDLSAWDGVAAACRSLFMALFCLELTKYTLHLWRLYRAAFAGVSV